MPEAWRFIATERQKEMKCPHCLVSFHDTWTDSHIGEDVSGHWFLRKTTCPGCKQFVIVLKHKIPGTGFPVDRMVWPKGISRAPLPSEVPGKFADDYKGACLVLPDSPKASAALSRRCLQGLLREVAGVKPSDLADEIQQVLDAKSLPAHLAEAIDAVRTIGNFAAHPIKSKSTGEIIDVEPGEAEWLLDTLEGLFDFYFVQPALLKRKRDALDAKLKEAGKPPVK
jgi:hypothetical protein